eukprot:973807-Pelagomonas_calceolata.AAC.2
MRGHGDAWKFSSELDMKLEKGSHQVSVQLQPAWPMSSKCEPHLKHAFMIHCTSLISSLEACPLLLLQKNVAPCSHQHHHQPQNLPTFTNTQLSAQAPLAPLSTHTTPVCSFPTHPVAQGPTLHIP